MGEARRKRMLAQQHPDLDRDAFAKVLREVIHKVYGHRQCLVTALTAERALQALGLPAEWRAGYAWWRVDSDAGAVLGHHPGLGAGGYHAWCVVGDAIVDFTTWSFHDAFAELDASDGRRTPVTWCPDYLWTPQDRSRSEAEVINGRRPGVFCYQREPAVEQMLRSDTGAFRSAEQLAPMVVQVCRVVDRKPFDITVTRRDGVEMIESPEMTLVRAAPHEPAPVKLLLLEDGKAIMVGMPGDAVLREMLSSARAAGVTELLVVSPDAQGDPVPVALLTPREAAPA